MKKTFIALLTFFLSASLLLTYAAKYTLIAHAFDGFDNELVFEELSEDVSAKKAETISLSTDSKSALLMEYHTGEVIYEKAATSRLPIASMVKIMTLLLAFEKVDAGVISLADDVLISPQASGMGGSQAFLEANVTYKLDDLLKTIVIASANDSSVAVAEYIAGSEETFVELMNKRAGELNMTDTLFINCTGLPQPGQYSCAKDVAAMTKELLKHKDYYNYTKIWLEDFKHPTGRLTTLTNTNKLIRFYADCDSGKTGYTSEALHCISASAVRGNMRLISVIIGGETSQKRFDDCKKLFNYAFANYENKEILNADAAIEAKLKVSGGLSGDIFVYPKTSYYIFSKKGEKPEVRLDYALPKSVKAPVKQGQTLGKIKIVKNNAVVAEVELVSREDVKRASIFHNFKKISRQFILANG